MNHRLLRVAVVGLGVGEQHALAYLRQARCKLKWVLDFDCARTERVLKQLGSGAKAESFQQILRDPEVDIISIASFDDAHFNQVVAAVEAGKHVFVEKPLCRSVDELQMIAGTWRRAQGVHLCSNLVLRAAPLYGWLREAIQAGDLGELYAFDGEYLYGRIQKITEGWRKDVKDYSVMQGGGVHLVDLMLSLTRQRPFAVSTVGNRICTQGTAFRYNDYMATTFEFASGLIGRITANFGCMHRHQHVVRIFGTKGTFIYDDQGPRLHTSRDPTTPPELLRFPPLPASKGELILKFVEGILNGKDTTLETKHEFDVISACVAADRALANKTRMEIVYT